MSFNKAYVKSVEHLKKRCEQDPESTARWLMKADVLIGPKDATDYAGKIISEYVEKK